jgi:hypothetical protein
MEHNAYHKNRPLNTTLTFQKNRTPKRTASAKKLNTEMSLRKTIYQSTAYFVPSLSDDRKTVTETDFTQGFCSLFIVAISIRHEKVAA